MSTRIPILVLGHEETAAHVTRATRSLGFCQHVESKDLSGKSFDRLVVMFCVDFTDNASLNTVMSAMNSLQSLAAHKLFYASSPMSLSEAQVLFALEMGARFTFFGESRDMTLKSYLRRFAFESTNPGDMIGLEKQVVNAIASGDEKRLAVMRETLRKLGDDEEALRLRAQISMATRDDTQAERELNTLLWRNPQNLWAANTLGKMYLRLGRPSKGIEVLSKISHFHDLNAERLHEVGTACLDSGRAEEGRDFLRRGDKAAGGLDPRFNEGLAKADLLEGRVPQALARLGRSSLSMEALSFLNTRGVMCARAGRADEALSFYDNAVRGCDAQERVVLSKLHFNMGIGYRRAKRADDAKRCFQKSVELGGTEFSRAQQYATEVATPVDTTDFSSLLFFDDEAV